MRTLHGKPLCNQSNWSWESSFTPFIRSVFDFNQSVSCARSMKELVPWSILSKNGCKMVFKASKFVITKNGVFVYIYEGLLKMNINVGKKNAFSSAYTIVSSDLWHARLECMNYSFIKTTMDFSLISKSKLKSKSREIFVQSRFS